MTQKKGTDKKVQTPKKKSVRPKVKPDSRAGIYKFVGTDGKKYSLTWKQRAFADVMLRMDTPAVKAVVEAGYDVIKKDGKVNWRVAASIASENLTKPNILEYLRVNEPHSLEDAVLMNELAWVASQRFDLSAKMKAMDQAWKLKGKYKKDQSDIETNQKVSEALSHLAALLEKE